MNEQENEIPQRFDHICADCGIEFSNTDRECETCCVCSIRRVRNEWDAAWEQPKDNHEPQ